MRALNELTYVKYFKNIAWHIEAIYDLAVITFLENEIRKRNEIKILERQKINDHHL